MTSIRRALAISFLEKYALIALSLVSVILIARLLTPEEIGIYSVAAALIGIAQVVRDFGIGNYLIQEKELTEAKERTAFGVSLIIGGSMFLLFALSSPYAGQFYADERMSTIVRIIALNFLVLPFCSISMSLLRRDMQFFRLMYVNIAAAIAGFIVTIGLAWNQFGPLSLAWGAVCSNIVTGVSAWIARKDRKLLLPGLSEWRHLASFGGQSTVAGVVTSIAMDINDLVIGKVLGFAPVAMLSRAQGLMNLFHRDLMAAVRNVAFPAYSQAHRAGELVEPKFVASVTNVTAFAWPFYGFIALYPLEILRLMFGPQWDAATPLVPVFALAGAFAATFSLISSAILALGRVDLIMRAELIVQPLRVGIIVIAALTYKTLIACATAFLIAFLIATPLFFWIKGLCIPNDWRALLIGLRKSLLLTALAIFPSFALSIMNDPSRDEPVSLALFISICIATLVSWLFSVKIAKHPIATEPLFKKLTDKITLFL